MEALAGNISLIAVFNKIKDQQFASARSRPMESKNVPLLLKPENGSGLLSGVMSGWIGMFLLENVRAIP